jgi:DNA-binding transcriptional LysR family regulator
MKIWRLTVLDNRQLRYFVAVAGFMDYVTEFVAAARPMPERVYPVRGIPTALGLVGTGVGVALVMDSWRSLAMANVVYRGIVDYERVIDMVLAHRTRESAPAVLAFVEACKGLQADRDQKKNRESGC